MKADQERVSKLLTDTVTLLCKNGLIYNQEIKVQGLLGITLDNKDVFIVQINEVIGGAAPVTSDSVEGARRRSSSSVNSAVVDLTRIADTPAPNPLQANVRAMAMMQHGMMPVPITGVRKQRQMQQQQSQQHMMMSPLMQSQQSQMLNNRPTYNPRQRMNAASMPPGFNNQFAASYMARLQQQVAMVPPPPVRMMSPSMRQRGALRRQPMPIGSAQQNIDDEEDVVIIGTGHEEPSPSWNSPSRRQVSLHTSSSSPSDGRSRPSSQISMKAQQSKRPSGDNEVSRSPSNRHVKAVEDVEDERSASDNDVTGTLELTAEDVPHSVEQLVLRATSSMITNEDGEMATVVVQPDHDDEHNESSAENGLSIRLDDQIAQSSESFVSDAARQANTQVTNAKVRLSTTSCNTDSVKSQGTSGAGLCANAISADEGIKSEGHPVVYTDNAESNCDLGDMLQTSTMDIETPGFDILTSEETLLKGVPSDQTVWPCRFVNCELSFTSADQLASHYWTFHGESIDEQQSSQELGETVNDETAAGEESFECPFPDCGTRLTSRGGLQAHKLKVHAAPPKTLPTMEGSQQRKRRATTNPTEQPSKIPHGTTSQSGSSSESISGGFLCPIVGCTAQYSNRDDMYEHVQLVHQSSTSASNAPGTPVGELLQASCKEEL